VLPLKLLSHMTPSWTPRYVAGSLATMPVMFRPPEQTAVTVKPGIEVKGTIEHEHTNGVVIEQ